VRLYQLNTPPAIARRILLDYVARIDRLTTHPEWYNTLTNNCTTAMVRAVRHDSRRLSRSWKLILNGHLDELLYEKGIVTTALPFQRLRQAVVINARAEQADQDPLFSSRIREGLPPR